MRPKSLVLLLLALGCGLVASIGISQVMDKKGQGGEAETQPIYVVVKDIAFNEPLTPDNIKLEEWPKDRVPPGFLSKEEEVKLHRAQGRMVVGEPVLKGKLWGPGEGNTVSKDIPKGLRVATVQVDATTNVGHLVRPGDRVDVLVFLNRNGNSGISETGTRRFLQDIQVFAVDSLRKSGDGGSKDDPMINAKTVSLLVTPEQGQKVALASEIGKIRLNLRRLDDEIETDDTIYTIGQLLGTDKGNRDKEDPDPTAAHNQATATAAIPGLAPKKTGVADWLMNAGKAALTEAPAPNVNLVPPAAKQPENFTMEVLKGSDVQKVEFRRDEVNSWSAAATAQPTQDATQPPGLAPATKTDGQSDASPADES